MLIDKVQIQQVLINLIRNGLEAMQVVDMREFTIETAVDNKDFARVTVHDSGPGLSEAVLKRLFQPFVTTKEKGMGIGLTICQSILEAHGETSWLCRTIDQARRSVSICRLSARGKQHDDRYVDFRGR
ncbi:MAG: ATP-binding protein [Rhizomicrobium sp.]